MRLKADIRLDRSVSANGTPNMRDALSLLNKYADTFRQLVSRRVSSSDKDIKSLLRLNAESDWDFLTAAMDIIGDASSAIEHVRQFGLTGPTKYNDQGETYLRLYGLLSATYAQQQAILTLYKIMQVPNPKDARKLFDQLALRSLRHKLSAHGTDYKSDRDANAEAFVPVRIQLTDRTITYANYTARSYSETVDVADAISAHAVLMVETMDRILEKTITTTFRDDADKLTDFQSKLADLRHEKAGGLVFKSPDGAVTMKITFVGSEENSPGISLPDGSE